MEAILVLHTLDLKRRLKAGVYTSHRWNNYDGAASMFDSERACMRVSPPAPAVLPFLEQEKQPYLLMEYIRGKTILELLPALRGCLLGTRTAVARCMAEAVSLITKAGVIHADVKPANVMLGPDGDVKMLDFGLSLFARDAGTLEGVPGTPLYIAPECARLIISPASDVWSLGATIFELVSGRYLVDLITRRKKYYEIYIELQASDLQEQIDRAIDEHVQDTEWNRLLKLMLRADPKERISATMAAAILRGIDRRDHTERLLDAASLNEIFPENRDPYALS